MNRHRGEHFTISSKIKNDRPVYNAGKKFPLSLEYSLIRKNDQRSILTELCSRKMLSKAPEMIISRKGPQHVVSTKDIKSFITQFFVIMFSTAGCIVQIWSLSSPGTGGYFSYDVVTSVTVAYQSKFIYPTRTLCFYTVDVIKWDSVWEKKEFLYNGNTTRVRELKALITEVRTSMVHAEKLQAEMLVKQLLTARSLLNITLNPEDIFGTCKEASGSANYEPCHKMYTIHKFLIKYYTCYTLDQIEYKFNTLPDIKLNNGFNAGIVSYIRLKKSFYDNVRKSYLYIHDPEELPSAQNPRTLFLFEMERLFQLSYTKYESKLLPFPYPTMCRNYSIDGFGSQGNCINDCTAKITIAKLDYNSQLTPVSDTRKFNHGDGSYLNLYVLSDNQLLSNRSLANISREISHMCIKRCAQPDCDDYIISPTLLSANQYPFNLFIFQLSYDPEVRTTTVEKIGVIGYLSNSASALGFWLGISLLSSLEYVIRIIRKILK